MDRLTEIRNKDQHERIVAVSTDIIQMLKGFRYERELGYDALQYAWIQYTHYFFKLTPEQFKLEAMKAAIRYESIWEHHK